MLKINLDQAKSGSFREPDGFRQKPASAKMYALQDVALASNSRRRSRLFGQSRRPRVPRPNGSRSSSFAPSMLWCRTGDTVHVLHDRNDRILAGSTGARNEQELGLVHHHSLACTSRPGAVSSLASRRSATVRTWDGLPALGGRCGSSSHHIESLKRSDFLALFVRSPIVS